MAETDVKNNCSVIVQPSFNYSSAGAVPKLISSISDRRYKHENEDVFAPKLQKTAVFGA
jgi:hypothetical protein